MEKIKFAAPGKPLWVKVEMKGIVILVYAIELFGVDPAQPKLLLIERGDNISAHDDQFLLRNPNSTGEPISANSGRYVRASIQAHGIEEDEMEFSVYLNFYQADSPEDFNDATRIDSRRVALPETIKKSDGYKNAFPVFILEAL